MAGKYTVSVDYRVHDGCGLPRLCPGSADRHYWLNPELKLWVLAGTSNAGMRLNVDVSYMGLTLRSGWRTFQQLWSEGPHMRHVVGTHAGVITVWDGNNALQVTVDGDGRTRVEIGRAHV